MQSTPSDTSDSQSEVRFYNAPHTDISVRTYSYNMESDVGNMSNVWFMPVNTAYRYPQGYNSLDGSSFSGCYM